MFGSVANSLTTSTKDTNNPFKVSYIYLHYRLTTPTKDTNNPFKVGYIYLHLQLSLQMAVAIGFVLIIMYNKAAHYRAQTRKKDPR